MGPIRPTQAPRSAAPSAVEPEELIGSDEAAGMLGLKPNTLTTWRSEKLGPTFLKVGRKVFYRRSDICSWLATRIRQVA
jgi:hypothetical protein